MSQKRTVPHEGGKNGEPGTRTGVARQLVDGVEGNPLALVAGGLALGIVAGALLPRSDRERRLLAPVGAKLSTGVAAAVEAAKDAGKAELEGAGLNRDNAREQGRNVVQALLRAASAAGSAAVEAAGSARR